MKPEIIDVEKEMRKRVAYNRIATDKEPAIFNQHFFQDRGKLNGADSVVYDPFFISDNAFGNLRTMSRTQYGGVQCKALRAVAEKAWVINLCISNTIRKIKPFLKPADDKNIRGYIIMKKGEDISKLSKKDEERERIQNIIETTGDYDDPDRDDFIKYCSKILRDNMTLDQIATEIQYNKKGDACAFFAIDAATVEKVIPANKDTKTDYRYMQVVDGMPAAAYTADTMVFDFQNPRTDIKHSMYGYSNVEQAIDLIVSVIHAFVYNSGNFTENKLPKGMLLLNGDANQEKLDEITDYICELMSGGPASQWRIPVIPSGDKDTSLKWEAINMNREMEFQAWLDYLTAGVVAMFGCSVDELGIQTQKAQALIDDSSKTKITASKGTILGDQLSFLEKYLNKIIAKFNPEYRLHFVGYEIDDPSTAADLDEKECRTWKTINEKRAEKGLKPLDLDKIDNGADLPMNVQLVQIFQAKQAQNGMGDMGGDMGDDMGDMEGGEELGDYGDEETAETEENTGDYGDEEETGEPVEKSIRKSMLII